MALRKAASLPGTDEASDLPGKLLVYGQAAPAWPAAGQRAADPVRPRVRSAGTRFARYRRSLLLGGRRGSQKERPMPRQAAVQCPAVIALGWSSR